MSSQTADPGLELAAVVAKSFATAGIDVVLIGAAALAVHKYPRATIDIDLASDVDPFHRLRPVRDALEAAGYDATLHLPDEHDPLGGVLTVVGPTGGQVQVVNFYNPRSARPTDLGRAALEHAVPANIEGLDVPVVDLPHLVALKLYAGGPKSRNDVIGLLDANPDADLSAIAEVCARHGLAAPLRRLLDELAATTDE